jgi:hypothetical protein
VGLEELEKIWEDMVQFYGPNLAHPDIEPKRFAYQCKLYRFINNQDQKSNQ